MRNHKYMRMLLAFFLTLLCSETGSAEEFELLALGVRGGMNFQEAGLPPGETEDFEQFEVFAIMGLPSNIMGLPLKWESPSGWELRWRLGGLCRCLEGSRGCWFYFDCHLRSCVEDTGLAADFGCRSRRSADQQVEIWRTKHRRPVSIHSTRRCGR